MMWLLLVHAAATLSMTGLIWFVQIVHYPLFRRVGEAGYAAYMSEHVARTTTVVGPLMLVEAGTTCALPLLVDGPARIIAITGVALLAAAWASTAFLQVPCHRRLERSFDPATIDRLVATNWIRTLAWTARSVLALALLWLSS